MLFPGFGLLYLLCVIGLRISFSMYFAFHSFNKHLLNTCYFPDAVSETGDIKRGQKNNAPISVVLAIFSKVHMKFCPVFQEWLQKLKFIHKTCLGPLYLQGPRRGKNPRIFFTTPNAHHLWQSKHIENWR